MKQIWKKIISMMLLVLLLGALSACGSQASSGTDDEETAHWSEQTTAFIEQLTAMEDADLEAIVQYGEFYQNAVNAWKENRDTLGAYVKDREVKATIDGSRLVVTADIEFEKKNAIVTMNIDRESNAPVYLTIEIERTLGEKMKEAAGNTVLGLLIVFSVLLFLSFLIYLFRFVNRWEMKLTEKAERAEEAKQPQTAAVSAAVPQQPEDMTDDAELVAVIAAAIAAAEQTSTDSFVVRSVKKVHRNNWKRA